MKRIQIEVEYVENGYILRLHPDKAHQRTIIASPGELPVAIEHLIAEENPAHQSKCDHGIPLNDYCHNCKMEGIES